MNETGATGARRNQADRAALWGVAGLTLFAFGLRLFHIDADSIWWDEGISLYLARGSWAALLMDRAGRLHPPLYFMLLKLWISLAGDSVFAARAFSLLTGLPGVALAYNVARRYAGRTAGWVAAGLAATAAVFVTYAQEVRVYALLPVMTLLMLALAGRVSRRPEKRGLWAALALVEAVALLLHYLSAISILYVNLWLIVHLWQRRREVWQAWLVSQLAALALVLPWLALVFSSRAHVSQQFALGSSLSIDPLPLPGVVKLVWTFLMSGHDRARFVPTLTTLAGVFGALLVVGALWLVATRRDRQHVGGWSLFDWLLPLAVATSLWALRPLSHPRYTMLWAGTLWVWAGIVLARFIGSRRWPERLYGTLGLLVALVLSGFSIRAYLFDPFFAKQDIRGVAALLREWAESGDVALVPWQDQSLPYYDTAPARVEMLDFREPNTAWESLADLTGDAGRIFVMEYDHTTRDPLGLTAYALEHAGALEEVVALRGVSVAIYRLGGPFTPPELQPIDVDLGEARLVGIQADPAPSDNALTVALAWQAGQTSEPLKATVQLLDSLGNTVALNDRVLLDPLRHTSDEWPPGTRVVNTYVLPLPQGTPPVTYDVGVALYPAAENRPGDVQAVTQVALLPPTGAPGDPYAIGDLGLDPSVSGQLTPGLALTGALYFPREARPGDSIDVMLRWGTSAPLPDLEPALRLEKDGETILDLPQKPANGQYPTDAWPIGEVVLDRRRLTLPPDAPPGSLDFSAELDGEAISLGELVVVGGSSFETPQPQHQTDAQFGDVARLVGYDLSGEAIGGGQPLRVTLYWQAGPSAPAGTDYTVFAHLIDASGGVVGQHDYPPVWGQRPTSGWRVGEYLVDVHDVSLLDGVSPADGQAHLEIGLYDPATLERLPLPDGSDAAILNVPIDLPQ